MNQNHPQALIILRNHCRLLSLLIRYVLWIDLIQSPKDLRGTNGEFMIREPPILSCTTPKSSEEELEKFEKV